MARQTSTQCYDYIIAGSGGAGLSLAWYISQREQLKNKRVLLLDADVKKENDRTWCFWTAQSPPFSDIQTNHWQHIQLSEGTRLQAHDIAPYCYHFTAGDDFYRKVKEHLAKYPNFVFQRARIEHIRNQESGAEVRTDQGSFRAKWVFSSLPVRIPKSALTTKQHFRGWYIRTKSAAFNPEAMTLMDFRTEQKGGASFMYVLPLTPHEALVEYTAISDQLLPTESYEKPLRNYLEQQLKISEFEIAHTEQGVIPMTNYAFPRQAGAHVMRIGTAGGMTKASTGFTFKYVQQDAQKIVQHLERKGSPFYEEKKSPRFRFYDTLLLHILKHYPEDAPAVFEKLFRRNSAATVLRFLDEQTRLWQEVLMFLRLPWKPFLRSLWQHYGMSALRGKLHWQPNKTPYYVPSQPEETQ